MPRKRLIFRAYWTPQGSSCPRRSDVRPDIPDIVRLRRSSSGSPRLDRGASSRDALRIQMGTRFRASSWISQWRRWRRKSVANAAKESRPNVLPPPLALIREPEREWIMPAAGTSMRGRHAVMPAGIPRLVSTGLSRVVCSVPSSRTMHPWSALAAPTRYRTVWRCHESRVPNLGEKREEFGAAIRRFARRRMPSPRRCCLCHPQHPAPGRTAEDRAGRAGSAQAGQMHPSVPFEAARPLPGTEPPPRSFASPDACGIGGLRHIDSPPFLHEHFMRGGRDVLYLANS